MGTHNNWIDALKSVKKEFWFITSFILPGLIVLEFVFSRGLFHKVPVNWIEFVLFLLWCIIFSLPYVELGLTTWITLVYHDKENRDLEPSVIFGLVTSSSLIAVFIHYILFRLTVRFGYGEFLTFLVIFVVTTIPIRYLFYKHTSFVYHSLKKLNFL